MESLYSQGIVTTNVANNQPVAMKYLYHARRLAPRSRWSTPTASLGWSATGCHPTSCSARWIQDGHQQRAINQIQEPSLMGQGPSLMAQGPLLASSPTSTLTLAHRG
jgi:hypothetical protein